MKGLSRNRRAEIVEAFLRVLEADPVVSASPSFTMQAASLYVKRGMQLDRVPALVEKELAHKPGAADGDWIVDPDQAQWSEFSRQQDALEVLIDGYLKAKDFAGARQALGRFANLVQAAHHPGQQATPREDLMCAGLQSEYLRYQGRLAAAQDRKADAFAWFWNALSVRANFDRKLPEHPMFDRAQKALVGLGRVGRNMGRDDRGVDATEQKAAVDSFGVFVGGDEPAAAGFRSYRYGRKTLD